MADQSIAKQVKKYKLVFIGDQSVGKTSIINRFINDSFLGAQQPSLLQYQILYNYEQRSNQKHQQITNKILEVIYQIKDYKQQFQMNFNRMPTVGIDFVAKTLHLDNKTIRLQLWDTAGQERFRSLIPSYIRDSDAAIIVYDMTNQSSFASVNKWLDYVREERGDGVLIVLLANKLDLPDQRVIQSSDGQQFANQQNLKFYEVSAKEGNNINDAFKNVAQFLQGNDKADQTGMDFDIKDSGKCTTSGGTIQLSHNQEQNTKKGSDNKCQC